MLKIFEPHLSDWSVVLAPVEAALTTTVCSQGTWDVARGTGALACEDFFVEIDY